MNDKEWEDLFASLDTDHSGYLDANELKAIVPGLAESEFNTLINQLDTDKDGRISVRELREGLYKTCSDMNSAYLSASSGAALGKPDADDLLLEAPNVTTTLRRMSSLVDPEDGGLCSLSKWNSTVDLFKSMNSHNEAFQVYCHLAQEDSSMLHKFEVFIEDAIQQLKEKTREKSELELVFEREQKRQQERMLQMEEEYDSLTKRIELKTAQKLNSKYEEERKRYEAEIDELKNSLVNLGQQEADLNSKAKSELVPLRNKLNDMEKLVRQLQSEKTEAETAGLLAKSQLLAYRQNSQQTSAERERDKEVMLDYISEQADLARQVHQLQEANKHLQDVNADLQGEMCVLKRKISRRDQRKLRNSLQAEIHGDDLDSSCTKTSAPHTPKNRISVGSTQSVSISLSEELNQATESEASGSGSNSQVSRVNSLDSAMPDTWSPLVKPKYTTLSSYISREETDTVVYDRTLFAPNYTMDRTSIPTSPIIPMQQAPLFPAVGVVKPETPQRIFKVIFTGDTSVGKSSFIMKICKGIFNATMSTTLGIDFHTKTIHVGEQHVMLQLWDTAGQERFRSISTSYFRKADGVVLLFDCCNERSFLSIRGWVHNIRTHTEHQDMPIVICANKTDLRYIQAHDGKTRTISQEEGESLAQACGAMFVETSAKTGENLNEGMHMLATVMMSHEDSGIKRFSEQIELKESPELGKKKCC